MMASMRTYTIFRNAKDFPGKFVTRGFTVKANDLIPDVEPLAVTDTLDEARAVVPPEANVRFVADPIDEPQVVETWM